MLDMNWSVIREEYKFAAMDDDGVIFLYETRPVLDIESGCWDDFARKGGYDFMIYTINHRDMDWKESLTERP